MKCVICKSPDIKLGMVEEEVKSGTDILLVPMKILVCEHCGERYYDTKAMRRMEDLRSSLKRKELKVEEVGKVLRAISL
jgi:YgiT-type zinc finger domain-containing protein